MKKVTYLSLFALIVFMAFSTILVQPQLAAETGAAETGGYRNLFAEIGKSDTDINNKVNGTFNQLFYGDYDNQRIYYEVGTDEAYILDTGDNYVKSEGQSYGMMICVQMNKKGEFDRLWKWAKNHMKMSSGVQKGYFAWKVATNGAIEDASAASDGEAYFVTALIFAESRWGSGSGIYNYGAEARDILYDMRHQADDREGVNMFGENNQVVFCPNGNAATYTDASYHLPAFYEVWGRFTGDSYWYDAAGASRWLFAQNCHATTGLASEYCWFDGTPYSNAPGKQDFRADAYRVVSNAAVDYAWWGRDSIGQTVSDKVQAFFYSKGMYSYGSYWTRDGWTNLESFHDTGLVAMNAVGSLAATNETLRNAFIDELWNTAIPTGQWRYYNGCLYLQALLHASGKFKCYYNTGNGIVSGAYYKIEVKGTGRTLDAGGTENESPVQVWDYWGGANQQWQIVDVGGGKYKVLAGNSGRDMDVIDLKTDNGTKIQIWDYAGGANQQWQIISVGGGYYKFIDSNSGRALDIGGTDNGSRAQLWDYWGTDNQLFSLTQVP